MSLRFTHVIGGMRISFIFKAKYYSIGCTCTYCPSIHLSVNIWVASSFWLLWTMLLWTWCINICAHPCFLVFFFFFEYMSRCGIAGSYSSSRLNFWSQFHTVSHHGCPVLQSHQHAQDPSFLNGHLTTVSHALGLDTAFSRLFFKLNILQVALHEDGHFRVDFFKGKNQRGGM